MALLLLAALAPLRAQEAASQPPPAGPASAEDKAFFQRVSACSAVMKQEALLLKARHEQGDSAAKPEMQRLTEYTFAMIGRAYLRGLRGPQADQMLEAAEAEQKAWPAPRLKQLLTSCEAQGKRTLEESTFIERGLVRNRAAARVERLLRKTDKP